MAADVVAARVVARSTGERVEVEDLRTETAQSFVNPDGSVTVQEHAGVQRFRDGNGRWVQVDLGLAPGADGVVRAKAHPGGLRLSPGGRAGGDLVSVDAGRDGQGERRTVTLAFPGALPAPVLAGSVATYRGVSPGVDARVVATRSGFEQFFILGSRDAVPAQGLSWQFTVRTKGLTARAEPDGSVSFVDAAGVVVSSMPTAVAWDGSVDEARGDREDKYAPVALEVTQRGLGLATVTVRPDKGWLADPARVFPVTVDPQLGQVWPTFDTSVQSGTGSDMSSLSELKVGTYDGGGTKTRSFLRFDREEFTGALVTEASLSLYETWSYSCTPSVVEAWTVAGEATTATRWTNQPGLVSKLSSVSAAKGYSSGCPAGRVKLPVTSLVQAWSGATRVYGAPVGSWLGSGQSLAPGQSLASANGRYYLAMQWDGNLVAYGPTGPVWNSGTSGSAPASAVMQPDGNLVIWRAGAAVWNSGTWGHPGAGLGLQDDGNAVIYSASSTPLWWSGPAPGMPAGTIGVVAGSETSSSGWKRFASSDSSTPAHDPVLEYTYNMPPVVASGVSVLPAPASTPGVGPVGTASLTPTLAATLGNTDGASVTGIFQVIDGGGATVWQGQTSVASGAVAQVSVPAGVLSEGVTYGARVMATDWEAQSWWSPVVWFVPDVTAPGAPSVAGDVYTNSGDWQGGVGQAGTFTFTPAPAGGAVTGYRWAVGQAPSVTVPVGAGGSAQVPWTPAEDGPATLRVSAVDAAGNTSAETRYLLRVGQAGLISPDEGDQVVRRVRLAVSGPANLTHVRFVYRRGAGATPTPIPVSQLRLPDGTAVTSEWIAVSTLAGACPDPGGQWTQAMADFCDQTGGYARWDAGQTLGGQGGPVQVQAQFATDAAGGGAVATNRWTTITVNPDGDGAAATGIGPVSVNLLTGDATITGEDAAEYGISVGRVASSRDPTSGYRPQGQLLTPNQAQISTDTAGFTTGTYATVTRDTTLGHTGGDALTVTPPVGGTSGDTFTTIGPADSGMAPYLTAGRRYRVSGWMYVPAGTGLTPAPDYDERGLRLVAFTRVGDGPWVKTASARPTVSGAWVNLSMDVDVPAGTTQAFVRVYNGNSDPGRPVYVDDLSVRQLWAPFGPQWAMSISDDSSATEYDRITQPDPDTVLVHYSGGGQLGFLSNGQGGWFPEPGGEGLTLATTTGGGWRLTDLDGTVTDFTTQAGADGWPVTSSSPPVANGQTRYVYQVVEGSVRPSRIIAPIEPGVDSWPANAQACTSAVPAKGCEVLELVYATSTNPSEGTVTGQVREINAWAWDPGVAAVTAQTVTRYSYDPDGRLVSVVDPRLTGASHGVAQPLGYGYDGAGRVTGVSPAGELPWSYTYGAVGPTGGQVTGSDDLIDANTGRLIRVTRASLTPARPGHTGYNTPGPDISTSMVYQVPITRAAGGPYDLDGPAVAGWGQVEAPSDATAVFGPDTPIISATATGTTPGRDGYRAATVTYLDASGQAINTASPAGAHAPAAGYIDTAEYDIHGNVVRTLEATNRLIALGQVPDAGPVKAQLGLTGLASDQAALQLSTITTYAPDGIDLLRTVGPVQRLAIGNDPEDVRVVRDYSATVYDEGAPDFKAYHLPTTETEAVQLPDGTLADVSVDTNGYDPVDNASPLGPSSGWVHGSATTVSVDVTNPAPNGAPITSRVRYDGRGRAVQSWAAGATGDQDPGTRTTAFYTAGPHPDISTCGNTPEWAGQPCQTRSGGAITGHDPARMSASLTVKTVTGYDRTGNPTVVTETNGAASRTSTTTYDGADRVASVAITGTDGAPVGTTVTVYDDQTGNPVQTRTLDGAGVVVGTVSKQYDDLDRMTRYVDVGGAWTDTVFDTHGKPVTVVDSTGSTQQFGYDRTAEPRGFLTSVTDSVAGTITATYTPDGQVATQSLPGGVTQTNTFDAAGVQTGKQYTVADGADPDTAPDVIAASVVVENGAGQWVSHTTTTGSRTYAYATVGWLTSVTDRTGATGACTTRTYAYNNRAGRTTATSASTGTGTCLTPAQVPSAAGAVTTSTVYDSADRVVSTTGTGGDAWGYDPFGRITTTPLPAGGAAQSGYYVNDLLASQEIPGLERMDWSLDPLHRVDQITTRAWNPATTGWVEAQTQRNHYDGDDDSPAWVAEDATLPTDITRYIDGVDGTLAVQTGKTGNVRLQLSDLHGDITATLDIDDGQSTVTLSTLSYQAADEYGQTLNPTTGTPLTGDGTAPDRRYGWLGGEQRSAQAMAGTILMGVRVYHPGTGRFTSPDPTPGGNSTPYDYCSADPVNCTDLDGNAGISPKWKKRFAKVGKIAEYGSYIPGPIGTASAAISTGAYAASGNKKKAIEMGITTGAALLGCGACAKGGIRAAKGAYTLAKARKTAKAASCPIPRNSFEAGTPVLMADGTQTPIDQVQVGDLVWTTDPLTGQSSPQPVLNTITGYGDKHLYTITTRDPTTSTTDTITATAGHDIWVHGKGWTPADHLTPGDHLSGATGGITVVQAMHDHGWLSGHTVYNLHIANTHTYHAGVSRVLVHNCTFANPANVRFTQSSIAKNFQDGRSVRGLAADLRSGRVKPSAVKAVRVVKFRNSLYALDNRRLFAFKSAGVPMPIQTVSKRSVAAEWRKKFTTRNRGTRIHVRGE